MQTNIPKTGTYQYYYRNTKVPRPPTLILGSFDKFTIILVVRVPAPIQVPSLSSNNPLDRYKKTLHGSEFIAKHLLN